MYRVDTTEDLIPISYLHYEKLKYQKDEVLRQFGW